MVNWFIEHATSAAFIQSIVGTLVAAFLVVLGKVAKTYVVSFYSYLLATQLTRKRRNIREVLLQVRSHEYMAYSEAQLQMNIVQLMFQLFGGIMSAIGLTLLAAEFGLANTASPLKIFWSCALVVHFFSRSLRQWFARD